MFKNVKGGAILAEFGEVLAQLRQKRHISQAELGRAIFVSGGTISNYEKGCIFLMLKSCSYLQITSTSLLIIYWGEPLQNFQPMSSNKLSRMRLPWETWCSRYKNFLWRKGERFV